MSPSIIMGLMTFAFIMSVTPGPNNMMLLASGANFGLRRTLPHMLGVGIGFVVMCFMVGMGIIQILDAWPLSYTLLKVVSTVYLIFLAYKIAIATPPSAEGKPAGKPITFMQALLFQWVNPKAVTMAVSALSIYAEDYSVQSVAAVAIIFGLVNLPSVSLWTILGQQMQKILSSQKRLTYFNWIMASLLIVSLIPAYF